MIVTDLILHDDIKTQCEIDTIKEKSYDSLCKLIKEYEQKFLTAKKEAILLEETLGSLYKQLNRFNKKNI